MANSPIAGYDTCFGNKRAWVGDHFGPAVYATGGELLEAKTFGWGGFDFVDIGNLAMSFSGTYFAVPLFAPTASGSVPAVEILWYDFVTGLEVAAGVNLSAERIRLFMLGV